MPFHRDNLDNFARVADDGRTTSPRPSQTSENAVPGRRGLVPPPDRTNARTHFPTEHGALRGRRTQSLGRKGPRTLRACRTNLQPSRPSGRLSRSSSARCCQQRPQAASTETGVKQLQLPARGKLKSPPPKRGAAGVSAKPCQVKYAALFVLRGRPKPCWWAP